MPNVANISQSTRLYTDVAVNVPKFTPDEIVDDNDVVETEVDIGCEYNTLASAIEKDPRTSNRNASPRVLFIPRTCVQGCA